MNIFRTIDALETVLQSGKFEYWDNGQKGYWDFYEYSWGKQTERITGISVNELFARWYDCFHMYQEADKAGRTKCRYCGHLFDPFNLKQGYIIISCPGVNDLKR